MKKTDAFQKLFMIRSMTTKSMKKPPVRVPPGKGTCTEPVKSTKICSRKIEKSREIFN